MRPIAYSLLASAVFIASVAGSGSSYAADKPPAPAPLPKSDLVIRLPKPDAAGAIQFSPDGSSICAAPRNGGSVYLFDTASGSRVATISGHSTAVNAIAFTPDGKRLVTGSFDGTVRVWKLPSQLEERRFDVPKDSCIALAVSPDGATLAIGDRPDGRIDGSFEGRSLADGTRVPGLKGEGFAAFAFAYSPDGKSLAIGRYGSVEIWDTSPYAVARVLSNDGTAVVNSLSFSSDGKSVFSDATGACSYAAAWCWDVAGKSEPTEFRERELYASTGQVFFLPDTNTLIAAEESGRDIFDLRSRRLLGALAWGDKSNISSFAVSRDGKKLAFADKDGAVRIWNLSAALKPISAGNGH